ncbi:MAG: DUF507 family protein [bacterium]|nr:DUF507 family protein [bacterium]
MRINEDKIVNMGKEIALKMQGYKGITLNATLDVLQTKISGVILENMKQEDDIDKEAKMIIEQHQKEIKDGSIDHYSLLKKVKDRLVKQKGFVI